MSWKYHVSVTQPSRVTQERIRKQKERAASTVSPLELAGAYLKAISQEELDSSGPGGPVGHSEPPMGSETAAAPSEGELGVVEEIDYIHSKVNPVPVAKCDAFQQTEVNIIDARQRDGIPSQGTLTSLIRSGREYRVDRRGVNQKVSGSCSPVGQGECLHLPGVHSV